MAAIGINMEKKKIQEIKNGVVTKATVIDYSMNLDNSYKELYEYEVGKFLVRAYSKYSKNSSTNIGKIKGKKSYVVYDKKYPEKVQGLFDLASMSILFLIQILWELFYGVTYPDNIGNRYFIIADLTAHVYQY